jgi:putative hydrolase of the HAD superfamily
MRAVMFDLYCTLVPGSTGAEHADSRRAMGKALRLDPDAFAARYDEAWPQRLRGELGDLRESIRAIAARVDPSAEPTEADLNEAVQIRSEFVRAGLIPTARALSTLETLREAGWRLGLLSNCARETEDVFPETALAVGYFDAIGLSSALGVAKPKPEAYQRVAAMLGVATTECVFVGDGAGDELPGAVAVGARAIQVTELAVLDDPPPRWDGERVRSLTDLPALLGHPVLLRS